MKITRFEIFSYKRPLKPLKIKNRILKVREGLIIKITDEKGRVGLGEVAPLPGVSRETLAAAKAQTFALRKNLLGRSVSKLSNRLYPSVRFGVESSLFNLTTKKTARKVPLQGLLQGSRKEICREAKRLAKKGIRMFKVKVGGVPLKESVEKVIALRGAVGGVLKLRLDANRAWTLNEAVAFGKAVGRKNIEYIEEPLKDPSGLEDFFMKIKIPFALDETLIGCNPKTFRSIKGLTAVVLKPTLLGLSKTFEWIAFAKRHKIKPILSSSFETEVGISTLAKLAASCHLRGPMGLDTLKYFR